MVVNLSPDCVCFDVCVCKCKQDVYNPAHLEFTITHIASGSLNSLGWPIASVSLLPLCSEQMF